MSEQQVIEYIGTDKLVPFKNHPFKMRDGTEKEQLLESIKAQGTIPIVWNISICFREFYAVRNVAQRYTEVLTESERKMEVFTEIIGIMPASTD